MADVHIGLASAERVFKLLDRHSAMALTSGISLPTVEGCLELQDIWFQYPTRNAEVLRSVSLRIPAGSTMAITGRSGCGKVRRKRRLAWHCACSRKLIRMLMLWPVLICAVYASGAAHQTL